MCGGTRARSFSLPPFRYGGLGLFLGCERDVGMDLSGSFSLTDVRRGGISNSDADIEPVTQVSFPQYREQRGRSRRRGGRSKSSHLGVPKCLRLVEAVRGGGEK
ncbi:hypothetical protein A2U01_0044661 [Trifolium medium]|uniref:Uncharacterized protein n=1 Tax=Trifolium medium TaxID=97028 RepID=A0A392QGF3_9FABA|nr:hypothetical protein [Trifolium medium]